MNFKIGIFDALVDTFDVVVDDVTGFFTDDIPDFFASIGNVIIDGIKDLFGKLFYWITVGVLKIVYFCEQFFNVFSGSQKVSYNGEPDYLINVFFGNSSINGVYWAMALLGIVFVFAFTIVSVIRKSFDARDKMQNQSMGVILGNMFKSILTMLLLTAIMSAIVTVSNRLVESVTTAFNEADSFSHADSIEFTDEQFATMARIYRVVGNYSVNPSYDSPYNLNSCYNEIRPDLQYLQDQGVFDFIYETTEIQDGKKVVVDTWQSMLADVVHVSDLRYERPIDAADSRMFTGLTEIMKTLRENANFRPIERYSRDFQYTDVVGMDRIIFLCGTSEAAKNPEFNRDPYLTDGVRGAFYVGDKDIYDFGQVSEVFDYHVGVYSYVMVLLLAVLTLRSLLRCIVACISRIFNMLGLYLIAPFAMATMPLDDGAKFKQWVISMTVQALSIFGYIIPMRLMLLVVPLVFDEKLQLFDNVMMNFIGKTILIVIGVVTVDNFSQVVTGILADNAGIEALHANDATRKTANKIGLMTAQGGWGATKLAAKGGLAVAGLAAAGVGALGYHAGKGVGTAVKGGVSSLRSAMKDSASAKGLPSSMMNQGGQGGLMQGDQGSMMQGGQNGTNSLLQNSGTTNQNNTTQNQNNPPVPQRSNIGKSTGNNLQIDHGAQMGTADMNAPKNNLQPQPNTATVSANEPVPTNLNNSFNADSQGNHQQAPVQGGVNQNPVQIGKTNDLNTNLQGNHQIGKNEPIAQNNAIGSNPTGQNGDPNVQNPKPTGNLAPPPLNHHPMQTNAQPMQQGALHSAAHVGGHMMQAVLYGEEDPNKQQNKQDQNNQSDPLQSNDLHNKLQNNQIPPNPQTNLHNNNNT